MWRRWGGGVAWDVDFGPQVSWDDFSGGVDLGGRGGLGVWGHNNAGGCMGCLNVAARFKRCMAVCT